MQMSVAGTIGGLLSVVLLWQAVEADSLPRLAVIAGAMASFTFGSVIEWPVLRRVRRGGDPRGELERITPAVLGRAGAASLAVFVLGLLAL